MVRTAAQAQRAIGDIIALQMQAAQRSDYDWKVCVRAVGAADALFQSIPVQGGATDYVRTVILRLTNLRDSYNDPDGEYTSGASDIGSVVARITSFAQTLR